MWILNYLPSWLIHVIPLVGLSLLVASYIIKFIPFINTYNILIKLSGIILLLGGVWLEGGWYYYHKAESEIKRIEAESKAATLKIEAEYNEKLSQTKQRGETIVKYVDKYITTEADAKCVIPNSFVVLHNGAVHNQVPDTSRAADESPSGVALSTTTKIVVDNYNTYHEVSQQLISLQKWIKEQQKIRE